MVEKTTDEREPFDAKVFKTVEDIIFRFFVNVENSLIFICSDSNDKALQRHKIYESWYKKSKHKENIVKIDNVIAIETDNKINQKLYTSLLIHVNNPDYNKLISVYMRLEEVMNNEK